MLKLMVDIGTSVSLYSATDTWDWLAFWSQTGLELTAKACFSSSCSFPGPPAMFPLSFLDHKDTCRGWSPCPLHFFF